MALAIIALWKSASMLLTADTAGYRGTAAVCRRALTVTAQSTVRHRRRRRQSLVEIIVRRDVYYVQLCATATF